ncbi:MAG: competence protein ComEC [Verrucomicrobiota bacterium]
MVAHTRQPFVILAFAAAIGIAVADYFPASSWPILVVTSIALVATLLFPLTPLFVAVVGASFFCLHSARITRTPAESLAVAGGDEVRPVTVNGIVVTEPKTETNGIAVFILRLRSAKFGDETLPSDASVLVRWRGTPKMGDELELFGTLQPIEPPRNPGEFDMRAYLRRRGVKQTLIVRYPDNGQVVRSGNGFSILRAAAHSRQWMQRTLSRGIEDSPEVAALICGTALGLRHQTRDDIEEPFQQTGTLHLFAVAGLHVGIVAWLLWTVATVLRLPRKTATGAIIPLLLFYAAITGLHTASLRAAIMAAILLGGVFFDRKVFAINSLAAAAFLILLWDSNELFTSGFQLSFSVVAAIVLFAEPLFICLRRVAEPDPFLPRALLSRKRRTFTNVGNAIARGASVSVAAWIGSLPLIYWYFHLVTPVSLFANLTVVPIAYFVLALAMLSLMAAPISSTFSIIFNNANWLLSHFVLGLVQIFAAVPFGHIYLQKFTDSRAPTAVTVLDEGTGAASHIRANGYDWLIDCGSARTYERTLKAFLHSRGVNRLEGLILTHGDALHIGAAGAATADFQPRAVYYDPLDVRSGVQRRLLAQLRPEAKPPRRLVRGDSLAFGRGVRVEILYPPPDLAITSADDAPLIARLKFGETSVLFESDAGAEAEAALVAQGDNLRSDILIKGQHHSGGSGSAEFLAVVQPKLIIATSRETPLAERIDERWAADIAQREVKLLRQDLTGAVELEFRDREWSARAYLTGEIFRSTNR